jgi:hypothetical protein
VHDPEVYKDPIAFNPDPPIAKPAEPDPFDLPWATDAGEYRQQVYTYAQAYANPPSSSPRSACPGNQVAQAIMYIFGATVLSVFNVEKVTINGIV